MSSTTVDVAAAMRRAAVRATRAPSVHNTQPWRMVLRDGRLEIRADWTRRLQVLDPAGRQLLVSCGCAAFNARVALAADGVPIRRERFPDVRRVDLIARLTATSRRSGGSVEAAIAHLDHAIEIRQSNRRRFEDEEVPDDVTARLVAVAREEGARLFPVTRRDHRRAVARLSQQADGIENATPGYRAELRRWTTDDPNRVDGVPAFAVPRTEGRSGDEVPIRDFDARGTAGLPGETQSSADQCLLVLGTYSDNPGAWIAAGEALERVLLEAAHHGYTASLFTQVIEVPYTRALLRAELGMGGYPHVLIRIGRAMRTPVTRRRRLVEVIVDGGV